MADGFQVLPDPKVSLGPDTAKLELHYGVVLLRSQERVRFRYMLQGFDKDWNEATEDRVAHYTNLPAGHYKFRVAAFEMNNPDEIAETSLDVVQRPHFYRTFWFLSICMISLAAVVWSIHKFRLRQLSARFRAVLYERNRLAREMHDTLIQGCVSVSALLEAHFSLGQAEAEADTDAKHDLLSCARTQLRTTIDEAREAVWNLRQTPSRPVSLGPLLRKMTEDVTKEFGIPVECRISGKPFELRQEIIHELLMVVREAIYNAVRHGHPNKVQLDINFEKNQCRLTVQDDGAGFDPDQLSFLPVGHYGLVGMRERVQRMGGKLVLHSQAGAGTEVSFRVPRTAVPPAEEVQVGP